MIGIGVKRVILGTKAIEDMAFLRKALKNYGDKICVSLDCSNGFVAQRGWVSTTNIKATTLAYELEAMGLQWMVYTDIARDKHWQDKQTNYCTNYKLMLQHMLRLKK